MKALEFLNYRRPDLEIRPLFIQQLAAYELRLTKDGLGPKTSTWAGNLLQLTKEVDQSSEADNEEITLRNTYVNALLLPNFAFRGLAKRKKNAGVKWPDRMEEKKEIASFIPDIPSFKEANEYKTAPVEPLKPIISGDLIQKEPIKTVIEVEEVKEEVDKQEPDMIAVPITKGAVKLKKIPKRESNKRNLMEKKYKDEILEIVDLSAKCASEGIKDSKEIANIINNNNINSIIIQNPQNIQLNTFISPTIVDDKKAVNRTKKVFYIIIQ